jgi:hypothetical protein
LLFLFKTIAKFLILKITYPYYIIRNIKKTYENIFG